MANNRSEITVCIALLLVIGFCFAFVPTSGKSCTSDDECACLHGRGVCQGGYCRCVDIQKECDVRKDCAPVCNNPENPYCGNCVDNICICEYC